MLQYIIPVVLILLILVLIYYIMPKFFKDYQKEKLAKLVIFILMAAYLAYDFTNKEKWAYLVVLALGSFAFVVLILDAKKKG